MGDMIRDTSGRSGRQGSVRFFFFHYAEAFTDWKCYHTAMVGLQVASGSLRKKHMPGMHAHCSSFSAGTHAQSFDAGPL